MDRGLYCIGLAGNDRRDRTVPVRRDDVTIYRPKRLLDLAGWGSNRGHEALVRYLHGAHLSSTGCRSAHCISETEDARDHQCCVFAKAVSCDHIREDFVISQETVNSEVRS